VENELETVLARMRSFGLISLQEASRLRQGRPESEDFDSFQQFKYDIVVRLQTRQDSGHATAEELAVIRLYKLMRQTHHLRHSSEKDQSLSPSGLDPKFRLQQVRKLLLEYLLEDLSSLRIFSVQAAKDLNANPPQNTAAWAEWVEDVEKRLQAGDGRAARRGEESTADPKTASARHFIRQLKDTVTTGELPDI
jgi:hypothetical protein